VDNGAPNHRRGRSWHEGTWRNSLLTIHAHDFADKAIERSIEH
jgi:hypothetical protein